MLTAFLLVGATVLGFLLGWGFRGIVAGIPKQYQSTRMPQYTDPRFQPPPPTGPARTVRDVLSQSPHGTMLLGFVKGYLQLVALPTDPRDHVRRLFYNSVLGVLDTPVGDTKQTP